MKNVQKLGQIAILSLPLLLLYQTSLHYLLKVFQTEISSYPSQPPSTEQIVVTVLCHSFCETKYSQFSKHKLALSERFESNLFKRPSTNRPKQTFVQFIFPKYFLKTQEISTNSVADDHIFPFLGKICNIFSDIFSCSIEHFTFNIASIRYRR